MDLDSMFNELQTSNNTPKASKVVDPNRLTFKMGEMYTVRIIPNINNIADTFWEFEWYGVDSFKNGEYLTILSPNSWGERCPMGGYTYKCRQDGGAHNDAILKKIRWNKHYMISVYVVDDPVTPENNGTVKYIRVGKQIKDIIDRSISGKDKDEVGKKAIDFSKTGKNLRIDVETKKSGTKSYPQYTASKFLEASAIPGITKPAQIKEIYGKWIDPATVFDKVSQDQMRAFMDEHVYVDAPKKVAPKSDPDEDVPFDDDTPEGLSDADLPTESTSSSDDGTDGDDDMAELDGIDLTDL